ncbi:MAG TPA: hypothetical protein VM142_16255 [Acidimicrobiales bacterium]|nr:hypothetical protein [Acidimicrobiales bacterium]
MNVVLDDHLLREVLIEHEPAWLRRLRRGGHLSTTGSWYYRLCGALHDPDLVGSLSGPVAALPAELRAGVIERVIALPSSIQLVSMRELAWPASGLGRRHGLNLLAAEALGAAVKSGAAIATAANNLPPKLMAAAMQENVRVLTEPNP